MGSSVTMKSLRKNTPPIVDSFGRLHNNLRIGVTDRCNIRCTYCMPEKVTFLPRNALLTFEEIHRFVSILAAHGVDRLRLTGGEPLVRKGLSVLIAKLKSIAGIEDIALTTNGILLRDQALELKKAGLDRLNISLDTLDRERFKEVSRRDELPRVLDGIDAAVEAGFEKIRLNTVSVAGVTEDEIIPLARFARDKRLELRFIEFMPLDADENWRSSSVLSGEEVRRIISDAVAPLVVADRINRSQPARDYNYVDGNGTIGFIDPVSQPFCSDCNRMRITSEGKFRNCLFSTVEWDIRELLRNGSSDEKILERVRECVGQKKAAHGIDSEHFERPGKAMYQIGG
ncbi:MAG: GTP 3',8-cyclase MoaA [Planctomycetota bacterium]